ncbi:uncharacterized protein LOC107266074 [Cephus cinctus]|uniref:Uncharacterized protein LOC107266074 n=1 Tax=Cephus cinctus TaxID=211228 RepID=A0AAJ7REZ5_CEPCN|nr:uncharacterized protein LOC107266074 [Cephus cinctus]
MNPSTARSNRPSLQSSSSSIIPSSHLHQQQIHYGPITTLQPCTATLHPSCIFPARNAGPPSPASLQNQVASSTFAHGPYPTLEHYANSGVNLITPPYFKPPENICTVSERQPAPHPHSLFYHISAINACSLQTGNPNAAFHLPGNAPYAVTTFSNNQISAPLAVQSAQIFPSSPIGLVFGSSSPPVDKHTSGIEAAPSLKSVKNKTVIGCTKLQSVSRMENSDWVSSVKMNHPDSSIGIFDNANCREDNSISKKCSPTKNQDERHSDESSASFDFTIEAEEMVSALCNTASSNDLGKEDRNLDTNLFNGAGDNISNKSTWFADFSTEYSMGSSGFRNVATQTLDPGSDQQFPELIRKTTYWGCSEAENILNSAKYSQDPKRHWLSNMSSATRTAIMKSSTCFPVFAGDRVFIRDLINALIRISNGWLVLDNYLNKQYYTGLAEKYDSELIRSFHFWESTTYELLRNVIETFLKLEETAPNTVEHLNRQEFSNSSFPGDVSLYTPNDLVNLSSSNNFRSSEITQANQTNQESAYAVHYTPQASSTVHNFRYLNTQQCQKETKLRGKWTMTENLRATVEGTKSVPDMNLNQPEAGIQQSKFRPKVPNKSSSSRQSLNTEFCNLRNKVMESNAETSRQWSTRDRKRDFAFNAKSSIEPSYQVKQSTYGNNCSNKCMSRMTDASFSNPQGGIESYVGTSSTGIDSGYVTKSYSEMDYGIKSSKVDHPYTSKSLNGTESIYVGKPPADQVEPAPVPRNRMTLLSQIEPDACSARGTEEMTANLSAWFASMRNTNCLSSVGNPETKACGSLRSPHPQEMSRSSMDLVRQLQMDSNRQLQTLKNMQSIQSAPWNVCNLINNRNNVQQQVEEYDSSEDVRVYMKPGSYNVPKKRHQRRPNRRTENTSSRNPVGSSGNSQVNKDKSLGASGSGATSGRISFTAASIVPPRTYSLENSPRILRRGDSTLQDIRQDVTWKAACASAEILLEALNVKEPEIEALEAKSLASTIPKPAEAKCVDDGASSYEASEDDSGSTCKLSPGIKSRMDIKSSKTNVKTDSWLIRTLNNASIKQRQEPDLESSESSNSSIQEDEPPTTVKLEPSLGASTPRETSPRNTADSTDVPSRATYSETVRRSTLSTSSKKESSRRQMKYTSVPSTVIPVTGKKCQRKDVDRSYMMHKSRKSTGRRVHREVEEPSEESFPKKILKDDSKTIGLKTTKKKDNSGLTDKNKSSDRGWSVWYSSRRRQSLSPLALNKLESIHQTIWQLDEEQIFKYPPSTTMSDQPSNKTIEDYYKAVKCPLFLETIGYKFKNRVYHKVEHAVRDFRRIIYNSRICFKNDTERLSKIEDLSKKLEELLKEHFPSGDFETITGSPRDISGSPIRTRCKLSSQKAPRHSITKKNSSCPTNTDNLCSH